MEITSGMIVQMSSSGRLPSMRGADLARGRRRYLIAKTTTATAMSEREERRDARQEQIERVDVRGERRGLLGKTAECRMSP